MTCRLYAERKGWPLRMTTVQAHRLRRATDARDQFSRQIAFDGDLDQPQRARLMEIANKCPVHRVLSHGARIDTTSAGAFNTGEPDDGTATHISGAERTCAEIDGAQGRAFTMTGLPRAYWFPGVVPRLNGAGGRLFPRLADR